MRAKAQVRHRYAARFFGVILEIGLDEHVAMIADNLDGIFVRAHRTVAAESPKFAFYRRRSRGIGGVSVFSKR